MKGTPQAAISPLKGGAPLSRMIGRCVRDRSRKLGITRADLARLSGVSRTEIYLIETGERNPRLETIERLCAGLGVTALELLAEADGRSRRES